MRVASSLVGFAFLAALSACAAAPGMSADGGDSDAPALDAPADASCVPRVAPPATSFTRHGLDPNYRAEGIGVLDVDRDGHPDLVTDQRWWQGPDFTRSHEIRSPVSWDPATAFADEYGVYPLDVDGDGWLDIVVAPHHPDTMSWYQNPQGREVHWTPHVITPNGIAGLENPIVESLFTDGPPVLVMSDSVLGIVGWYTPPAADPTQPWVLHAVSGRAFPGAVNQAHGIGVGDVNGDGRPDLLTGYGWFEQPPDRSAPWPRHDFSFGPDGRACSRMWAYDVNGDGMADVFCARPHDYGLYWFEQQVAAGGGTTFTSHLIDDTLSQMHALRLADLDGDGVPELVTGKRWWAEGPAGNPGVNDPALLVYYSMRRCGGAVSFARHVIDDDSGVGGAFAIADLDGDGRPEVVTANKKGAFWFHHD